MRQGERETRLLGTHCWQHEPKPADYHPKRKIYNIYIYILNVEVQYCVGALGGARHPATKKTVVLGVVKRKRKRKKEKKFKYWLGR